MEKMSPAITLLNLIWNEAQEGKNPVIKRGFSWPKFNRSMSESLSLAIYSGLEFFPDDFILISERFRPVYWMGGESGHFGEHFYSYAVRKRSLSAARSFEKWKGRKPFTLEETQRIYEGRNFLWEGEIVRCTSFSRDGNHLTACLHNDAYRRFKITQEGLADYRGKVRSGEIRGNPLEKSRQINQE